jgi:thiopurine S-methyltransferase
MQADYWHSKWSENQIGFHQDTINKRLQAFWPSLELAQGAPVFVPLCGKSLDMLWLHRQGHPVLGIELSEKAVKSFFTDNGLPCTKSSQDGLQFFTGKDQASGIELIAGDFFDLTPEHLVRCKAYYDRASMIAMGPAMRADYARHLARIMAPDSKGLLLTIEYDQSRMQGPPFSVTDDNVRKLLQDIFSISELAHYSGPERLGNLAKRGLETLDERVYLLTRQHGINQSLETRHA